MDTKFYPNVHGWMGRPETHLNPEGMRNGLSDSLKALGSDKVDLWYLHAPDRSVPLEETLRAVNELYKQGKFKRWGEQLHGLGRYVVHISHLSITPI
jgi:aflatoxin B1 aldehyde reductase